MTATKQEYQLIKLSLIKPDKNQPRKFFDENALNELIDSVREKGVIQPILVRPEANGKTFKLVCGERRFRAALAVAGAIKERDSIPAIVKELSDEEALDLQIIENLQRKDVNPVEEANAFKMMTVSGKTAEEIGLKVGKSPFFVRQRLALTQLTENWQKTLFHNHITIKEAMKIAQLTEKSQTELFESEVNAEKIGMAEYKISIGNWGFNRFSGDLADAPFDINDSRLNPERPSCATCPFNTNHNSLFPEPGKARCGDISCFSKKTEVSFNLTLTDFKEKPDALFVAQTYSADDELKKFKKDGLEVFTSMDYDRLYEPDQPDREEFIDDEGDEYDTPEKLEAAWQEKLRDFAEEQKEFDEKIAKGLYKPALVVHGNDKGKVIYIKLSKKGKTAAKSASAAAVSTAEDNQIEAINDDIERIKSNEKRAKELDARKVFTDVHPLLHPDNIMKLSDGAGIINLTDEERVAAARVIVKKLSYDQREGFDKYFKIKDIEKLTEVDVALLQRMIRYFIFAELRPLPAYINNGHTADSELFMKLADLYLKKETEEIIESHNQRIARRIERVDKKIKALQQQKKDLQSAKKKAELKAPAKKSAKKAPAADQPKEN